MAAVAGGYWFAIALRGRAAESDAQWARQVFVCSIFTIMALGVMMSVDFSRIARAAG